MQLNSDINLANRKRTFTTAIAISVAVVPFRAAIAVTVAMPSGPDHRPRARTAEQQESSYVRRCLHAGRHGRTDRDPVPVS